ncbi:MAG: SDR family oxidoreductase [Desulfobacterota bacterium]|jgi:3-oxoacyl-[acyl-carrier protein] reductase|nr:SDR family oxidoreductase [Thermodesulfobacteriota bacterium]
MKKMMEGKVAIITGSGRGIGRATALLFAQEGARVVVNDLDPVPADETVAEIRHGGGEAVAYVGDVTAQSFAEGIVRKAVDTWGSVHVLVNNAGFIWDAVVHTMTDEQWTAMLDVHVTAPFRIIRAAAPYFREAAKRETSAGRAVARKIINISSLAGAVGNAGQANYAAAKSAVLGLTKTLAKEWGRYNVQANTVAFGWIETRLTQEREAGETLARAGKQVTVGIPSAQRQIMTKMIPLGRPGTPEEAAGAVLFFASPLSDYVSGEVLLVAGGLSG